MDQDVVISGISGRFPECDSMAEFSTKLYKGEDLITDDERRWERGILGTPARNGKLKDLSHFDADFFQLPSSQVDVMDPQARVLLEVTYEAIVDAGINPVTLRGSKTGVFVGACISDSEGYWASKPHMTNKWGCFGSLRSLLANRISYIFDFTGPSVSLDTACSSSLYAFDAAISSLKNGQCDAAIVAGSNVILNPLFASTLHVIGATSKDGYCKTFDASGNGYVRSEAIVAILLQRAPHARRHYAIVTHIRTNSDGNKPQSITFPSSRLQTRLLKETYAAAGIAPNSMDYIEAHGTGTKVGDPVELNALAEVFCKNRCKPLHVGSVKSNMGHSEAASGLCAIAKVLLTFENGELPPNLHFNTPNPLVPDLMNGNIQVVCEKQPWNGIHIGISSFGMGGANAHLILRRPHSSDEPNLLKMLMPTIVCVSGRTSQAVDILLNQVIKRSEDTHFMALLREIHIQNIPGHCYRGYTVLLPSDRTITHVQPHTGAVYPVWFVFSGMGSQWTRMGRDLLQLPVFQAAVDRCAEALRPIGLDLVNIILSANLDETANLSHILVTITAIQIGLVDLLASVGVHPDGIIGHSIGELGCGYADGCLSAQQAILAAYYRAQVVVGDQFSGGAMAAVGMSATEARAVMPQEVKLACDNGPNSVTLSGPAPIMRKFAISLKKQGTFVKELMTCGVAFHSTYINAAGPTYLKEIHKVIPEPKQRSTRWVSSSIPRQDWKSPLAQKCSAEYFTHNLVSPVLFNDACHEIPRNAITVEIAPHGILQSVLKHSLLQSTVKVALQTRHQPGLEALAVSLGKLYCSGVQLQLAPLYPTVPFPVRRGTSMISPFVVWNHEHKWNVPHFFGKMWRKQICQLFSIDLAKEEDSWYRGHKIDNRIIFPAAGYLFLVWKAVAVYRAVPYTQLSVMFCNVQFHQATPLAPNGGPVEFCVELLDSTGQFVVTEGTRIVVSGVVNVLQDPQKEFVSTTKLAGQQLLTKEDIYKELRLRGYQYSGVFQGVVQVNENGGVVHATDNIVALLDTILQVALLHSGGRGRKLYLPTKFQKVIIQPSALQVATKDQDDTLPVTVDSNLRLVCCQGVQVSGIDGRSTVRHLSAESPLLEKIMFLPYKNHSISTLQEGLQLLVQLVLENFDLRQLLNEGMLKVAEFDQSSDAKAEMALAVSQILAKVPSLQADVSLVSEWTLNADLCNTLQQSGISVQTEMLGCHVILAHKLTSECLTAVKIDGFIVLLKTANEETIQSNLQELASFRLPNEGTLHLFKSKEEKSPTGMTIVELTGNGKFGWLKQLQSVLQQPGADVLAVAHTDTHSGVVGLVNCLRLEPENYRICCLLILDPHMPAFDAAEPLYSKQLSMGLTMNVYKDGQWGSFQHLPLASTDLIPVSVEHAYINTATPGDLASLHWIQGPAPYKKKDEILCHIYYSALNFHDIMLATGRLPVDTLPGDLAFQDCVLGLEISGRDSSGCRVMGMVPAQGLATTVLARAVWSVPEHWSLEEASTVPVVYCTAYYALLVRGKLRAGESVLIHAGSGGVGQAAISIALHMHCTVFTTVSNLQKRTFLKERFPQLTDCHIGNSRDSTFEQLVMTETAGRGVDLVLNSLSEEKLQASVRCLATHGRFLEIGQFDLATDKPLGLGIFLKNVSFHGICLDSLLMSEEHPDRAEVISLVRKGIETGVVQPLPRTVFTRDQAEQAFRYMAAGHHIGKVLLQIRKEEKDSHGCFIQQKPELHLVQAKPRLYFQPSVVCIITGGLGGFGLELADWLVTRGARHLVLSSRTGLCTGYRAHCLNRWKNAGVNVKVSTADITTLDGTRCLLKEAMSMGPVSAIFHLAAVLSDGLLLNQTLDSFNMVWQPKMAGAHHLDSLSRVLCPLLQHFVLFSSASSGRGNPGQSNYGLASSAMERVVEQRRMSGLPGLAIQWGPIADVGLAVGLSLPPDILPQSVGSCLATLEQFMLQHDLAVVSSLVVCKAGGTKPSEEICSKDLLQAVSNVLGVADLNKLDADTTLMELGMDSIMQVEIRIGLERYRGLTLSNEDIQSLTVGRLKELDTIGVQKPSMTECTTTKMTHVQSPLLLDTKLSERSKLPIGFLLLDVMATPLIPTETLVLLSLGNSTCESQTPLFLVHPVDGTCNLLKDLAKHLIRPVYGLQFTKQAPRTTLKDLAYFYIQHVCRIQPTGPYAVGGYSMGATIGLEMALQLQKAGHIVNLLALDGLAQFNMLQSESMSYVLLETDLLSQMVASFRPETDVMALHTKLLSLADWQARLQHCLVLTGIHGSGLTDLKEALESCHWRIYACWKYSVPTNTSLSMPVLVVAAQQGFIKQNNMNEYGYRQVSRSPVKIVDVEGDHISFLQGPRNNVAVARIIDNWLNHQQHTDTSK